MSYDLQDLFNKELSRIFANYLPKKIALAVSGGVDSVAMLYLCVNWAKEKEVELVVFCVNHNLRLQAKEEQTYVGQISKELGCKFIPLEIYGLDKNTSGIQEKARQERYDLMTRACREMGIYTLFTAHHKNDVIENYLFRKERKASILGLSTSHQTYRDDIRIIRPLINFYKQDLIAFLQVNNIKWYEDSSNECLDYSRNKIRAKLKNCSLEAIANIESEIRVNDELAKGLEKDLVAAIAEVVEISNFGVAILDNQRFKCLSNDVRIYLLNHVLTIVAGKSETPRYRGLVKLLELILGGEENKFTLHDCQVQVGSERCVIYKELSKITNAPVILKGGALWDGRFSFVFNTEDVSGYYIEKIMPGELKQIAKNDNFVRGFANYCGLLPKITFQTLPAIKNDKKIVAIPHIFYYDDLGLERKFKVLFKPIFVSRFTHF